MGLVSGCSVEPGGCRARQAGRYACVFRVVWPQAGHLSPLIPASPPAERATVQVRTWQAGSQNDLDLKCSRGSLKVAFPAEPLAEEPSVAEDAGPSLLERTGQRSASCWLPPSWRYTASLNGRPCFLGFCGWWAAPPEARGSWACVQRVRLLCCWEAWRPRLVGMSPQPLRWCHMASLGGLCPSSSRGTLITLDQGPTHPHPPYPPRPRFQLRPRPEVPALHSPWSHPLPPIEAGVKDSRGCQAGALSRHRAPRPGPAGWRRAEGNTQEGVSRRAAERGRLSGGI